MNNEKLLNFFNFYNKYGKIVNIFNNDDEKEINNIMIMCLLNNENNSTFPAKLKPLKDKMNNFMILGYLAEGMEEIIIKENELNELFEEYKLIENVEEEYKDKEKDIHNLQEKIEDYEKAIDFLKVVMILEGIK